MEYPFVFTMLKHSDTIKQVDPLVKSIASIQDEVLMLLANLVGTLDWYPHVSFKYYTGFKP